MYFFVQKGIFLYKISKQIALDQTETPHDEDLLPLDTFIHPTETETIPLDTTPWALSDDSLDVLETDVYAIPDILESETVDDDGNYIDETETYPNEIETDSDDAKFLLYWFHKDDLDETIAESGNDSNKLTAKDLAASIARGTYANSLTADSVKEEEQPSEQPSKHDNFMAMLQDLPADCDKKEPTSEYLVQVFDTYSMAIRDDGTKVLLSGEAPAGCEHV